MLHLIISRYNSIYTSNYPPAYFPRPIYLCTYALPAHYMLTEHALRFSNPNLIHHPPHHNRRRSPPPIHIVPISPPFWMLRARAPLPGVAAATHATSVEPLPRPHCSDLEDAANCRPPRCRRSAPPCGRCHSPSPLLTLPLPRPRLIPRPPKAHVPSPCHSEHVAPSPDLLAGNRRDAQPQVQGQLSSLLCSSSPSHPLFFVFAFICEFDY
jgi:hypothetical protein